MLNKEFERTAQLLGHDLDLLRKGEEVRSTLTMKDVDELKDFIISASLSPQGVDKKTVEDLCRVFPAFLDDSTGTGAIRRLEAYIYNDVELSKEHHENLQHAFPIHIDTVSQVDPPPITNAGLIIKPGGTTFYNWGTVVMEPGAFIAIYGVTVHMKIVTLVRNGDSGITKSSKNYDIGILGMTGATGPQGGKGKSGGPGSPGKDGYNTGELVPPTNGGTGHTGRVGIVGNPGGRPVPCMSALLTIGSITGTQPVLNMITRSGTGGQGGKGGTGGDGGKGGTGGKAVEGGCFTTNGANGGVGGRGGTGGNGGKGADGADGNSNIIVITPDSEWSKIIPNSYAAPGGQQGFPGDPGVGGGGGTGGAKSNKDQSNNGVPGTKGSGGDPGNPGPTGSRDGVKYKITHHKPN